MSESTPSAATHGAGRGDRKVRNFLLDAPFQLKFAGYFVAVTLIISGILGAIIVRTTDSLFSQLASAAEARGAAADASKSLGEATLNSELAANMDNPELLAKLQERSKAIDAQYESEKAAAVAQRHEVERQQRYTLYFLIGVLVGFVLLVALTAIVITHRIVGPLFRIKRMAREVANGQVRPPAYGLRPGDELQDVFEVFADMVRHLRSRTEADLEAVKAGDPESIKRLESSLIERLAK